MKQKWLLTGTALLLAAALAGCGNMPAADQAAKISMEQAQSRIVAMSFCEPRSWY